MKKESRDMKKGKNFFPSPKKIMKKEKKVLLNTYSDNVKQ